MSAMSELAVELEEMYSEGKTCEQVAETISSQLGVSPKKAENWAKHVKDQMDLLSRG